MNQESDLWSAVRPLNLGKWYDFNDHGNYSDSNDHADISRTAGVELSRNPPGAMIVQRPVE